MISKLKSKIVEVSSKIKNKIHAKKLAYMLAAWLMLSSCNNYEQSFDSKYDQESTLTELLSDYKETQKEHGSVAFETADYSKDIALWNAISDSLLQFIKKDPRSDRTLYIIDLPWYLSLVINNNLKKNGVNTTFDINVDYSDDNKVNDVDYSKFFWVLNKVGDGGPNDEHMREKKDDGTIVTKPYALLFDYNRVNEGLNDLENETTFHNQYTIEDDLPTKEMFTGKDAVREKVVVFTSEKMNQDLGWWLIELSKVDNIPVQVVIIGEDWSFADAEIPADLKTAWQDNQTAQSNQTQMVHSNGMPFWYRYRLGSHSGTYNTSYHSTSSYHSSYTKWCKSSSFKSNGVVTKTTPAHFQKSSPVRSSWKFSGGHSIRSS